MRIRVAAQDEQFETAEVAHLTFWETYGHHCDVWVVTTADGDDYVLDGDADDPPFTDAEWALRWLIVQRLDLQFQDES